MSRGAVNEGGRRGHSWKVGGGGLDEAPPCVPRAWRRRAPQLASLLRRAASHHAALCVPSLADGNQQLATDLADDVLTEPLPIASGPTWDRIDKPGLGVEVDADKLGRFHEAYLRDGQYLLPEYRPG